MKNFVTTALIFSFLNFAHADQVLVGHLSLYEPVKAPASVCELVTVEDELRLKLTGPNGEVWSDATLLKGFFDIDQPLVAGNEWLVKGDGDDADVYKLFYNGEYLNIEYRSTTPGVRMVRRIYANPTLRQTSRIEYFTDAPENEYRVVCQQPLS